MLNAMPGCGTSCGIGKQQSSNKGKNIHGHLGHVLNALEYLLAGTMGTSLVDLLLL